MSFASLDMNRDLGFGPQVYGLGAALFFVGYLLFEVPGAMLVEHRSARVWLAVMMFAWGTAATLMGSVQTVRGFYLLRVVLGIAEAGFFPGIIVYLSNWFTKADRARAIGALAVGLPAANLLGSFASGFLLQQHWVGVAGWRWLFIVEGLPTIAGAFATLTYLEDTPKNAKWLRRGDRELLCQVLKGERSLPARQNGTPTSGGYFVLSLLALVWFLDNVGVYGFNLWLPMVIKKSSGLSSAAVAWISSIPFFGALAASALVCVSSDRTGERRWHTGIPMLTFGAGMSLSVCFGQNVWIALVMLCVAALGLTSGTPGFWAIATAAPGGKSSVRVAIITSAGALGGFCGPYMMGYFRSVTTGFEVGLFVLGLAVCLAAGLVLLGFRQQEAGDSIRTSH